MAKTVGFVGRALQSQASWKYVRGIQRPVSVHWEKWGGEWEMFYLFELIVPSPALVSELCFLTYQP